MIKTDELKSNLSKLEGESSELEKKVKAVDDDLLYVHDKLTIAETIHERLSQLDSSLMLASNLLGIVRIIPAISVAASNTKRAIDLFREPVGKAKKMTADIDKRVKPVRTKVHKAEQEVAKLDADIKVIISREQSLIQTVNHAQICVASLPSGKVKTKSTDTLEALSEKANPPVGQALQAQHGVLGGANTVENKINQVKSNLKSLVEINASIDRVMNALDPLISQLQAIKKAFNQTIRVPFGGYPKMCKKKVWPGMTVYYPCGWYTTYFSFTIQQILDGITGVVKPVMDLLDKAMNAVLNPLLKALNLNIKLPGIPELEKLEGIIASLTAVSESVTKGFDQLLSNAKALEAKLQSILELTHPFKDIYQACVHGAAEEPPAVSSVMEENQTEADPAMFDALATLNERGYLFRGNLYWIYSPGRDEAEGPFAIADEFGKDDHGQILSGPFDAACVVDDRLCLFQGKNYYLCTPGENAICTGPMAIEEHWGPTASGRPISGPVDSAVSVHGRVFLFQGNQFYIATEGKVELVDGPLPIKGYWGVDNQGALLDGQFDAVTMYADRLYIRKGESFWDQPIERIKALS
jgi:hypothetical protein